MKTVNIKLNDIIPYKNNAKKHNRTQINNVAESIKQFGMVQPLVLDKNNEIVIGHCRYEALKKLGEKEAPCVMADDLTEEQIKKLRNLDNKLNESEWDYDLLKFDIEDLDFSDFDIDWEIPDLDFEEKETEEDDFDIELPVEPKSKLGDIYQLGNHRLMCGSSTNESDVAKLLDGEKARVLFTSPPYSDMREYEGGKNLDVANVAKFISAYRDYTNYQCVNLGIQRKNNEIYPYWDEYILKAKECGYKLLSWNVWDKTMCGSIGQQSAFIPIRHEWIFVFGTEVYEINKTWEKKEESINISKKHVLKRQTDGTTAPVSIGDTSSKYKKMESVIQRTPEQGIIRSEHPAVFPVGLPSEYIQAMTDKNDIVIEPFCGSGTTLIACEQLGRRCYGMELEPKYVDVIIERWEKFTGKKAVLLNE